MNYRATRAMGAAPITPHPRLPMKHILLTLSLALGSCCATATDLDASVITANQQREVIAQAAEVIQARYVAPALGRKVAQAIRQQANTDAFKHDQEPEAFAQALTVELRKLSGDGHFRINYSAQPIEHPPRWWAVFPTSCLSHSSADACKSWW